VTRYNSSLGQFRLYVASKKAQLTRSGLNGPEQEYFARVTAELDGYESDFQTTTLAAPRQGGGILVKANINGIRDGRFIFDTGASLMTISAEFARELGLPLSASDPVDVTLADGRRVSAKRVELRSVSVQDAEVHDVAAVVLDMQPAPGVDGLLGMSFLGNFYVSVDSKTGSITLKRFTK
jgi:clan AA aspartic protease (TIGR02281 family)